MNTPRRFVASIALGLALGLPSAVGTISLADAPPRSVVPTATQWDEMTAEINERLRVATEEATAQGGRLSPAVRGSIFDDVYARVNFAALDLETIRSYWPRISSGPESSTAARGRLTELAAAPDVDGANAAITLVQTTRRGASPTDRANAMQIVMNHPALNAALQADVTTTAPLASMLSAMPAESRPAAVETALGWANLFTADTEPARLAAAAAYAAALRDLGDAVDAARFQAVRRQLHATLQAGLAKAEGAEEPAQTLDALRASARRLDSSIMRGEFMGHAAPSMEFTWIHDRAGTPDWKSLEDLRGKVVILDFWATWCGPCIASFPNIAELRNKYSPDELVIIGVTSIQGNHYPRGRERIDVKDDPAREMQLMGEYMDELDIIWTVAFSAEPVFNPDYDVRGIPHLTIIDADGKVRHNGLHPSMPMDRKAELLDPLIAEARAKSVR